MYIAFPANEKIKAKLDVTGEIFWTIQEETTAGRGTYVESVC